MNVKIHRWIAACAFAGGAYCSTAFSQTALGLALEAAWDRSVQSKSATGELNRARAGQTAAQALWAAPPAVELFYRGDPVSRPAGQRESEIGLAWPLLLPGQRTARSAAAQAQFDVASAGERSAKLRLAGEVREAAWTVVTRRVEMAFAEAQADSLQTLAQDVARRVDSGDLARTDLLAAQAEHSAALAAASEAQQRLAASLARWRVLTGLEPPGDLPYEPLPAAQAHPELHRANLAAEAARTRLELFRTSRRDAPELVVRYRHEVAAAGFPSEQTMGVGVRIPFGTADRNEPLEAAAVADLDLALAEGRRLREQLGVEEQTARAAVATAEAQATAGTHRVKLLRERAQLLDKSFRAGETSLPEYLRSLAAAAQADGVAARQRAELGLVRARLNQALGVLP